MPYIPIPTPAIGGDIVAILLRQKARAQALQSLDRAQGAYIPPKSWIGDIPVSVKSQETYTFSADATEHAVESGAIYTDHVILHPAKIDVSFEITNWERGQAQYGLELLEKMWAMREPVELMTEHRVLQDMILINLSADNSVPNWGALVFRATFKQIKLVQLETVAVPPEKVAPAEVTGGPETPKSIETAQNSGRVSLLARAAGSFF